METLHHERRYADRRLARGDHSGRPSPRRPNSRRNRSRPPQVWAIVVGIDNYNDPGITDSDQAAACARRVLLWFRAAGWEDDHQLLMHNSGSANPGPATPPAANILPTRNNLNWAIDEWLLPTGKAGDLVVVYFAGQAETVTTTVAARVEPRVDHYLLPINTTRANLAGHRLVDRSHRRPVCFAEDPGGLLAGDGRGASRARPRPTDQGARAYARRDRRGMAPPADSPGRGSPPGSRRIAPGRPATSWTRRGLFTSALLVGLGNPESMRNLPSCLEANAAGFEARAPGIPGAWDGSRRD